MGGISIGKLLVLGCIIALVFGTKKLRTIGEDAGYALRAFQKALRGDDERSHSEAQSTVTGEKEMATHESEQQGPSRLS